jgi:hypothetical protein
MTVEFLIPGSVPSASNLREHWAARTRRVKKQREQACLMSRFNISWEYAVWLMAWGGTITLTRCAPRKLDSDNLAGSCKAIRDGIASGLGVNDGDERIMWVYAQEKCQDGDQLVKVSIEVANQRSRGVNGKGENTA